MSGVDDKGSVYARQLIRYASIDEMWQIELHNQESKHKVVEKVGSVEQWYNNANQYWSVTQRQFRKHSLPTMGYLEDTVT